jgi:DNA invertase Pin-like site-specific DNA recombinase
MRRAVLYLRVSTQDQTTANQERELREVAERMGCEITHVYRDHVVGGAKGRDKRPQFDKLCTDATKRQFDVVMAWSVDRLGRSLQDLVAFLTEIHALKVDLYFHQQGIDTTTPAGKAMFQMMGVFAEFERAMIQERVRAGLARARDEGKTLGRPNTKSLPASASALARCSASGLRWRRRLACPLTASTHRLNVAACEANEARADERAAKLAPIIKALRAKGVTSLNGIAEAPQRTPSAYATGSWTLACHKGAAVAGAAAALRPSALSLATCAGATALHAPDRSAAPASASPWRVPRPFWRRYAPRAVRAARPPNPSPPHRPSRPARH